MDLELKEKELLIRLSQSEEESKKLNQVIFDLRVEKEDLKQQHVRLSHAMY